MFMSFSDGMRSKLWSKTGQQPQWWTDAFISPPSPPKPPSKRDTHDWIPKRRHKRAPPVYSQEYYDLLRKEQLEKLEQKQLQLPLADSKSSDPVRRAHFSGRYPVVKDQHSIVEGGSAGSAGG